MSNRSRPPFWQPHESEDDDLRSSIEDFIESAEDAERYRQKNLTTLRRCEGEELLVRDIEQCSDARPCRRILCPLCARCYRIWFGENTLRLIDRSKHFRRPAKTLVVRLEQASNRNLPMVSIKRLHELLRKRLLRSGISRVIGGTEASCNPKDDMWTVHFHLLIFGASDATIKNFARTCKKDGIPRAVDKPAEIRHPVDQITYLQKFNTSYRAAGFDDRGKGKSFPMTRDQMAALANWNRSLKFENFLFLVGFRRDANGIQPTKKPASSQPKPARRQ